VVTEKILQSSFLWCGYCREDGEEYVYDDDFSKIGLARLRSKIECGGSEV
jgi:hypothetical protein